jgi:hypothetical protein
LGRGVGFKIRERMGIKKSSLKIKWGGFESNIYVCIARR